MGSALGNIASTAAGVAAGGFLFQGLERLLGNHAGSGIVGNQNPFSSLTQPLEKITANNYIEGETASEAADYQDNQDSNEDVDTPYDDTGSDDDDMFT
jgi:hypothetical protein